MAILWQDLQYAFRQLRSSPVYALSAILTLALAIGVNAAMFSVVDQVLLHQQPFPRAKEVVQIGPQREGGGMSVTSLPDLQDWRARSHSFAQIGFFGEQLPSLGGAATPKRIVQVLSSDNLFSLLEVRPLLGRTFTSEDAKSGHTNVLVLSAALWRGMFHADPQILGRTVPVGDEPFTVIGVMPDGFVFPEATGDETIWTPLPVEEPGLQDRSSSSLTAVARLRPGVTVAAAERELNGIHQQLIREYPKDEEASPIRVERSADVATGSVRPTMVALYSAVLAVWLIGCANVAGLQLARSNRRRREVALRMALGARRGRLIRQFLTESFLLSFAGGLLGLELAALALRLLKSYLAKTVIFGDQIHIDVRVCAYLFVASCVSAVLFGLVPALHAANLPVQEGLRHGTAGAGTTRQQSFWRDALVVGEIALTLTLLMAAGLMVRTLAELRHVHTGFVAESVTTGQIFMPRNGGVLLTPGKDKSSTPSVVQTFYDPLLEKLRSLPGVQAAGLTTVRPLEANWDFNMTVDFAGRPKLPPAEHPDAQARATSADYFKTMGIPLLQGRFFGSLDSPQGMPAAIVNRAFVRRFLPDVNPLGQRVRFNDKGDRLWSVIVGVVEDSPQKTLGQPPLPEVHYNLNQLLPKDELYGILGSYYMNVAVRSPLASQTVSQELQRTVHALQPTGVLDNVMTMDQVVEDSLGHQVLAERLLVLFAITGLLIAVAGIYGLLAYSVSQRTRELGVRLALGAQRSDLLWLVLRHACVLLGMGVLSGAFLTALSSHTLRTYLTFSSAGGSDLVVFPSVALLLIVCGLAASYFPARRAAGIQPTVALRAE